MKYISCTKQELDKFVEDYPGDLFPDNVQEGDEAVRAYNDFSGKDPQSPVAKTIVHSVGAGKSEEYYIRYDLWTQRKSDDEERLTHPDSTPIINFVIPPDSLTLSDDQPGVFFQIFADGSYTKADRFTPEVGIGIVLGSITNCGTEAGVRGAKAIKSLDVDLDVVFEAIVYGLRATYRDEESEE